MQRAAKRGLTIQFCQTQERKTKKEIANLEKEGDYEEAAAVPQLGKKCESAQQRLPGNENHQ